MKRLLNRLFFFLLGLAGLLSLIASIAAAQVTNPALMKEGFLQFSQTAHLQVPASRYREYAQAITRYLDGKTDAIQVPDPQEDQALIPAFSEKENAHMRDVRRIVSALQWTRWIGGGGVILILLLLYLLRRGRRDQLLRCATRGFAAASIAMLIAALALALWGAANFRGLFWTFHQVVFTNDLWLLDPQTDLLMALMPLPFFTWYAGEIAKGLLPIAGVMALVIIAYFKTKDQPS